MSSDYKVPADFRTMIRQRSAQEGIVRIDEIEAVDLFTAIVRPEPGALREHGLQAERSTAERQQPILEILRRQHAAVAARQALADAERRVTRELSRG